MQQNVFLDARGKNYEVDLLIPETKTVIEIYGPQHYKPGSKQLSRKSQIALEIKQRLARDRFRIVAIPYFEWQQLSFPEHKINYIRSL